MPDRRPRQAGAKGIAQCNAAAAVSLRKATGGDTPFPAPDIGIACRGIDHESRTPGRSHPDEAARADAAPEPRLAGAGGAGDVADRARRARVTRRDGDRQLSRVERNSPSKTTHRIRPAADRAGRRAAGRSGCPDILPAAADHRAIGAGAARAERGIRRRTFCPYRRPWIETRDTVFPAGRIRYGRTRGAKPGLGRRAAVPNRPPCGRSF